MKTDYSILVDNATLSGVERLVGNSKTKNLNYVANDILCFEKLVTAILFSDRIISVDDYKDEYKSKRMRNFDFINFLKLDNSLYEKISNDAANFATDMVFSIEGSKPVGDVLEFFDALRIEPQLRWDVFTSSEYLTMTLLVNENSDAWYEKAIDSVFRNERAVASAALIKKAIQTTISVKGHPEIRDVKSLSESLFNQNKNKSGPGYRSVLEHVVFGYGWAAERSYFYNAIAERNNADAFLAPLRDAFCESCFRIDNRNQVNILLKNLKKETQLTISKIVEHSGNAKFAMKLPFFTSYMISKADNPNQCIDLALKMRNQKDFIEARTILHNLQYLDTPNRYREVNGLISYLEKSCEGMLKKYAALTRNGPQISISLGLSGIGISTSLSLGKLFLPHKNKPFSRIFRNIAQDMLNIERMGALYEKLCSSIDIHKDSGYPSVSTTPKFMEDKENEYGRPVYFLGKSD